MTNQEFSVRDALQHTVDDWWIVVLLAVIGGVLGWSIHYFHPPLYESTSVITISMEFTPRPPLTPDELTLSIYEEDSAYNSAEFIINSLYIKDQIRTEANDRGFSVTLDQLNRELTVERRLSNWYLVVRDRDPRVAEALATIWAEKSLAALNTALAHSIQARTLEDQITGLAKNLYMTAPSLSYDQFQVALKDYMSRILQEKAAGSGILPEMTFTLQGEATAASGPALYNTGLLVFAGAVIGILASLWWVNRPKVRRLG